MSYKMRTMNEFLLVDLSPEQKRLKPYSDAIEYTTTLTREAYQTYIGPCDIRS